MTIGQALPVLAALGIPGAIMTLIVWRLERRIEARDAERQTQEADRRELELLNIRATLAALELADATASAVERIPDTHCNGEMHGAQGHAREVGQEVRDFLTAQGVRAVVG